MSTQQAVPHDPVPVVTFHLPSTELSTITAYLVHAVMTDYGALLHPTLMNTNNGDTVHSLVSTYRSKQMPFSW